MKYILASSSPRRKKILSMFDMEIKCVEHSFDEKSISFNDDPEKYCEAICEGKGNSVSDKYCDFTIISADTIVVLNNKILEKPESAEEAIGMLQLLSNNQHKVITAVIDLISMI